MVPGFQVEQFAPPVCAAALDQRYVHGTRVILARTGLRSMVTLTRRRIFAYYEYEDENRVSLRVKAMTYHGHIENGIVTLDEPTHLPDGTRVVVEVRSAASSVEIHPEVKRFSGILPKGVDYRKIYCEALAIKHQ
ncbi:MAG: hypothetical protein HY706_18075 [Candidatus Hydrogenedentes bacterium]|nr:hypothetical protein [Candidatus Hydrogenedentota bacterium]